MRSRWAASVRWGRCRNIGGRASCARSRRARSPICASRGQAVAALWASQAAIYQRYGYALASTPITYRIDTVDVGFYDGNGGTARVQRIDADSGFDVLKKLYVEFVKGPDGLSASRARVVVEQCVVERSGHGTGAHRGRLRRHRGDRLRDLPRARRTRPVIRRATRSSRSRISSGSMAMRTAACGRGSRDTISLVESSGYARRSTIRRRNCSSNRGC